MLSFGGYAEAFQGGRVSPHETVNVEIAGKQITIAYGRPSLKNREFGQLAPAGSVWRLGADEATKLTTPVAIKIEGGPALPAGSYSLWAIPGDKKWTMIVNKQADVWGTNYDQSQDFARFDLPVQNGPKVEEFTISTSQKSSKSATVSFAWATHSVSATLILQ